MYRRNSNECISKSRNLHKHTLWKPKTRKVYNKSFEDSRLCSNKRSSVDSHANYRISKASKGMLARGLSNSTPHELQSRLAPLPASAVASLTAPPHRTGWKFLDMTPGRLHMWIWAWGCTEEGKFGFVKRVKMRSAPDWWRKLHSSDMWPRRISACPTVLQPIFKSMTAHRSMVMGFSLNLQWQQC